MSGFTASVYKSVVRHFVTLSCLQTRPGQAEPATFVFSGFVVSTHDEWFFVTAGHIIRDIRVALDQGYTFDRWRLDDQTAGNSFQGKAVPFDFNIADWLLIHDDSTGLDYAAVWLRSIFRWQLQAGGIMAISEMAWGDHTIPQDHRFLLGIPRESVHFDGDSTISARIVLAPLLPATAPIQAGEKVQNQFYAHLPPAPESTVVDIDGMSGGPIFGLKSVDGDWKYQVIGVQSGWYRELRVIAACPFSSFGVALEDIAREANELLAAALTTRSAA